MSRELPEPWAAELSGKGVHSYRDFAAKIAGRISHETLRRLVTGGGTSDHTVKRVADALFGGDRTRVWALYGSAARDHGDWEPPSESSLLSGDERAAVDNLIRAFTKGRHERLDLPWEERQELMRLADEEHGVAPRPDYDPERSGWAAYDVELEQGDVVDFPQADLFYRDGDRVVVVEIKHTPEAAPDEAREQLRRTIEALADRVTVKAVPQGSFRLGTLLSRHRRLSLMTKAKLPELQHVRRWRSYDHWAMTKWTFQPISRHNPRTHKDVG